MIAKEGINELIALDIRKRPFVALIPSLVDRDRSTSPSIAGRATTMTLRSAGTVEPSQPGLPIDGLAGKIIRIG